jgi:hypothetical protein
VIPHHLPYVWICDFVIAIAFPHDSTYDGVRTPITDLKGDNTPDVVFHGQSSGARNGVP